MLRRESLQVLKNKAKSCKHPTKFGQVGHSLCLHCLCLLSACEQLTGKRSNRLLNHVLAFPDPTSNCNPSN